MNAVTFNITDNATPALKAKLEKADPHRVATRMAVPLARHWRDHLAKLPRNKHGYPSTGFWEDAARRVTGVADGATVRLWSDKIGLHQRYYGGTITAKNVKNLTIPICAEASGTKVSDWGFENLVLVILGDGRKFLALWLGNEDVADRYQKRVGKVITSFNRKKAAGKIQRHASERLTNAANRFREGLAQKKPKVIILKGGGHSGISRAEKHSKLKFLFRLIHSVDQAGNPDVIPSDLMAVAKDAALKALN